jgi:hypothetical protein
MRPSDVFAGREASVVGACIALTACLAADPIPPPATQQSARDMFVQHAWPALGYCVGCHGSQPAIAFLAPGTAEGAYDTVFMFQPPVIDLESPAASLLLTMGKHTGPTLLPADAATILAWLDAERDERSPVSTPLTFGPMTLALDAMNTVDLGHGATLAFHAGTFDSGLELTQLSLATTSSEVHAVHPLFVSRPTNGPAVVDALDRFDDVDLDLKPNQSATLTSSLFESFTPTDPITIHFRTLEVPQ